MNDQTVATPAVVPETTSFHFKSTKEVKARPVGKNEVGDDAFDEDGNALIAAGWRYTDKGWKRPSVEVTLPQVSEDDVVNILSAGGQGKQFLLAVCRDQFYSAARGKINDVITDNTLATVTADTVAGFGLNWDSMAADYLSAAESARATGIGKEIWDEFVADYVTTMLRELPQNGEEKIKNAAEHLKLRFTKCRSDKKMVGKLRDYLAIWFGASSRQEEFAKLFKVLDDRAGVLLAIDDSDSI